MKKINFFDSLETRLEKYLEGVFKEKHCGNIQPVDIAKRLFREMRNSKRVSVNSVFVPNKYIIYLNKDDLEALRPYITALTSEMLEYLKKKAKERKYTLVGSPSVVFQSEDFLDIGNIKVNGNYDETAKTMLTEKEDSEDVIEVKQLHELRGKNEKASREIKRAEKIPKGKLENTQKYSLKILGLPGFKSEQLCLVIKEGSDKNKSFRLTGRRTIIGRDQSCDIVLSDSSISRRHAVLEQRRKLYVIRDLNSTNGTFVNGIRITEKVLKPEDEIKLGTTLCSIRVD